MRIVFMGTPQYSVPTLKALLDAGHSINAVFSQPDKPVGRKQILTPTPTKVFAIEHNIPVFQPATLRDGTALDILKDINPDLIVVVAYGKILPKEILNLPRYGSINGHASLLPELRGASPVQWALVSGKKQTGVTVMQMDEGMDTGDILNVKKVDILPEDNSETLFSKLSLITAELLAGTVDKIAVGDIKPIKQDDAKATYAPIINREMAHLDFSKPACLLCDAVRGFYSWPVAFCYIGGKRIKVFEAIEADCKETESGKIINNDGKLVISCGENTAIRFLSVQPEGGRRMTAEEMLRGNKLEIGMSVN